MDIYSIQFLNAMWDAGKTLVFNGLVSSSRA